MDDMYLDKMRKYENLCLAWIQKADQELLDNDFQHTKQECYYLQQAINLRSEMARMSIGSEQDYHQRKARELNARIAEIVKIIDPEYMKRKEAEARAKAAANSKGNASGADGKRAGTSGAKSKTSTAIDEEEVKSWFKEIPSVSFEDVTGMPELKQKLRNCINDSRRQAIREYLGLRKQKSYFFVGPPGCGKTYLIKAFAHELVNKDYKYLSLVGSDILSKYVGDAEKTITRLFEVAEENAPCIVFIDEIDGVCKNRSLPNLPEYAASITTAFLTGYNRINASDKPIIFIGATNYPNQVDNAMLDRVELIHVPFPDQAGRVLKFRQELGKCIQLTDGFTFEAMGEITESDNEEEQYNYRDIERLCEELKVMVMDNVMNLYPSEDAAVQALKAGTYGINRQLFEEGRKRCLPTPKKSIIKELREWRKQFERRSEA